MSLQHSKLRQDQGQTSTLLLDAVSTPFLDIPVGGHLKHFALQWRSFTSDPTILDMVSGMTIDLVDLPYQRKLPHEIKLNSQEFAAASEHISTLLSKKAIIESTFNPKKDFLSNVFLRPKHDGGYRMILNLKQFNKYVDYAHFKMESLQNILDLVTENCVMCILDLSDAYLTVPIGRKYVRFLKFQFNGKVYCYVCLPFGISSAPRKFTKLLKPIIAWLRQHCIVLVIYIDDIWITATTYLDCLNSMYKPLNVYLRSVF